MAVTIFHECPIEKSKMSIENQSSYVVPFKKCIEVIFQSTTEYHNTKQCFPKSIFSYSKILCTTRELLVTGGK